MGRRVALLALLLIGCSERRQSPPPPPPPPSPVPARVAAIGDTSALPPDVQRMLAPSTVYRVMTVARGNDWLAQHPEPGQTFDRYAQSSPNPIDGDRRIIYLLPLGDLPPDRTPPLAELAALVHAFFTLEVRVLPAVPLDQITAQRRTHDGKEQLLTPDLLQWLPSRLPADAYALMAVTMVDLYPSEDWNYVFGQATLAARVGVQSFARYDPAFFDEPRPENWRRTATQRAAHIVVHELAHMFGMEHCVYWQCVVNGANSLEEADRQPLHLCPVCLHKLWWLVRFDPAAREDALAAAWRTLDLASEAAWAERRASEFRAAPPRP